MSLPSFFQRAPDPHDPLPFVVGLPPSAKTLRFFRRQVSPPPLPPAPTDGERAYLCAHIPKCGGKTFNSILLRNFTTAYYREESLDATYKYPAARIKEILQRRFTLRAVSSHRLTFDLPWAATTRPILGLTFVRDPVERTLSEYFFQRQHPGIATPAKSLSADDYVARHLPRIKNFQSVFLGSGRPASVAAVTQLLDQGWAHVFPLERFEEAMLCLERAYPADFRDASFKIHNQASRDAGVLPSTREIILAHSPLDLALVALAHRHLDQFLDRLMPSVESRQSALAGLRRRNAQRSSGTPEKQLLADA